MKASEEIYWIIFNKIVSKDGKLHADSYVLGDLSPLGVPKSITIKGDKITVIFEDDKRHVFTYSDDVELFYRPKEEKK